MQLSDNDRQRLGSLARGQGSEDNAVLARAVLAVEERLPPVGTPAEAPAKEAPKASAPGPKAAPTTAPPAPAMAPNGWPTK